MTSAEPSRHEPYDQKRPDIISTDHIDTAFTEMYGVPSDKGSVLLEIYTDDGEEKWVWTQPTSGNDMSTRYVTSANPMGVVIDKLPDYIVQRYDPYIQSKDLHNGALYPPTK
jgi:hypothetical protein